MYMIKSQTLFEVYRFVFIYPKRCSPEHYFSLTALNYSDLMWCVCDFYYEHYMPPIPCLCLWPWVKQTSAQIRQEEFLRQLHSQKIRNAGLCRGVVMFIWGLEQNHCETTKKTTLHFWFILLLHLSLLVFIHCSAHWPPLSCWARGQWCVYWQH